MKFDFSIDNNNSTSYTKIGKAIKELYPIGITNDTDDYKAYPGTKKIKTIIEETFNDYQKVSKPWKVFLRKLKTGKYRKAPSAWMPHDLAFSGEVPLERYEDSALLRLKYLVFSVSRVASFYTVYGVDETVIKDVEKPEAYGYSAFNVITESPYSEFKDVLTFIQSSISAHFPGYDFIPIRISLMQEEGLHTLTSHLENCRVHNALFNNKFDFCDVKYFRGERYYGSRPSNIAVILTPPSL